MNTDLTNVIRKTARERLEQITEFCSYRDGYPHYIHDLFYLYSLIASRSLARYYEEFGHSEISLENVRDAKKYFNYPQVSDFERDCISYINAYLVKKESEQKLVPMHYPGGNPNGMAVNS
ncbi:MAG TPA: hypothetical protein PK443_02670 [bacterium]|nr:hypothetical protein [bacterium]